MPRYLFQGQEDSQGQSGPTLQRLADRADWEGSKRRGLEHLFDLVAPLALTSTDANATFVPANSVKGMKELYKASKALSSGMSAKEVFDKYGIFRGAKDNQLRAYIPDTNAKLNESYFKPNEYNPNIVGLSLFDNIKLPDILDHPELYKAQPELRNVTVGSTFGQVGGNASYDSAANKIRLSSNDKGKLSGETLSTLLHEVQHAIQTANNFTPGGSPSAFLPDPNVHEKAKTLAWQMRKNAEKELYALPKDQQATSPINDTLKQIKERLKAFDEIDSGNYQLYRNIAGEAEARAVQNMFENEVYKKSFQGPPKRYGTVPEYNPSPYPWEHYDVPMENLAHSPLSRILGGE